MQILITLPATSKHELKYKIVCFFLSRTRLSKDCSNFSLN